MNVGRVGDGGRWEASNVDGANLCLSVDFVRVKDKGRSIEFLKFVSEVATTLFLR